MLNAWQHSDLNIERIEKTSLQAEPLPQKTSLQAEPPSPLPRLGDLFNSD